MKSDKKAKPKTVRKKMNPVVHFEMPYKKRKRVAKFYSKSFGWETNMLGEEYGNYVLAMTSEAEKNGTPKKKAMINGGFYKKNKKKPAQYPSVVITVNDIKRSIKKIEKSGGELLGKLKEIPEMGMYVSFYDTEGNRVGLMEPFVKK